MSLVDSFYKRLSGQTSFVVTPAQLNITRLQIRITNHPRKWFLNYYWPPLKIYLLSVAYPPTPRPGDLTNCHFNYFSVSWICPTGGGEGGVWCVSSHPNQSAVMTCHKTALWSYQLMGRLCCLLTSNYSSDCRDGGLMDPVAWRWNDRHYPPPILLVWVWWWYQDIFASYRWLVGWWQPWSHSAYPLSGSVVGSVRASRRVNLSRLGLAGGEELGSYLGILSPILAISDSWH